MDFRAIDDQREMLVDFYVSDMARGIANVGLSLPEAEALRLAIAYERENGREPVGKGFNYATSRMLDNVFRADDGAHESAKFLVADLALQRFATEVLQAGETFQKTGEMPSEGKFEDVILKYVIPDIADDVDAASDWKAMGEGRFHDVSLMSKDIVTEGVNKAEYLPENAGKWLYENQGKEDEPRSASEAAADMSAALRKLGYDVAETSDRMDFTKIVLVREGGFSSADQEHLTAAVEGMDFHVSEIRLTREGDLTVDVLADNAIEISGDHGLAEWLAGEPGRHEWDDEEHAAKVGGYLGQFRKERMEEELRNPVDLVNDVRQFAQEGWKFPDDIIQGVERLDLMVADKDSRTADLARSLAEAVMSDRGVIAGAAEYWNFMEGSVPKLGAMLLTIGAQDRGEDATWSIGLAVKQAASGGMEAFDNVRMEMATGTEASTYQPFRALTGDDLVWAGDEIQNVQDKLRHQDHTIAVDPGLERAMLILADSGLGVSEARYPALERAFARAEIYEREKEPLSPNEKARMIIFDAATQEEARGLEMAGQGGVMNTSRGAVIAKPAQDLVSSMGIRTLAQDGLSLDDISKAASGRFEKVSEYHRAGIHLGMSWAREGNKATAALDERIERLLPRPAGLSGLDFPATPGVVGEVENKIAFSDAMARGIASQASGLAFDRATQSKGARQSDSNVPYEFNKARDRGRG